MKIPLILSCILLVSVAISGALPVYAASDIVGKVPASSLSEASLAFDSTRSAKSQILAWKMPEDERQCVLDSIRNRFPSFAIFLLNARAGELPVFDAGLEEVEDGKLSWDVACQKSFFNIAIFVEPSQPEPSNAKGDESLVGHLMSIRKISDILCRCVGCLYTKPGQSNKTHGSCSWCDFTQASQCPQSPPITNDPTDPGDNGGGREE
jgi:hypothetical protein